MKIEAKEVLNNPPESSLFCNKENWVVNLSGCSIPKNTVITAIRGKLRILFYLHYAMKKKKFIEFIKN